MKKIRLGILGASTLLASELLLWLEKWHFPWSEIQLFDTVQHRGYMKQCGDHFLSIQGGDKNSFIHMDILFICDDGLYQIHKEYLNEDCYILNLGSYQEEDRMILPQATLDLFDKKQFHYYIPNASLFVVAHIVRVASKISKIAHVSVHTSQSVSEVGYEGYQELINQVHAYAKQKDMEANYFPTPDSFQHLPLLFQSLPQTSKFLEDGSSEEENFLTKGVNVLLKEAPSIVATCTRVPCIRGLSLSIVLQLKQQHHVEELMDAFAISPSFICVDDTAHDMYPIIADVLHDYRIFIGRMRMNEHNDFIAWAVCDDLSARSAAAIQCALYIYHNFL